MPSRDMTYGVHLKTRREGQQAYSATQRDLKAIEDHAKRMTDAFRKFGGEGTREMGKAQAGANRLAGAFERLGRSMQSGLGRAWVLLQRIGRGIERLLARAFVGGAVALGVFTAAVVAGGNAFADYEQQIANAVTVTGLIGDEALAAKSALSDLGLELAKTSRFAGADVGASFYDLASAGFTVEQTMAAMPGIIALAESTLSDLSFTTESVARTLTIFQLEGTESTRVANTFAAAISASMLQMYDLSEALSYGAPLAAGLGMSIEETVAALAMLSQGGILGSRAGTTLMGFLAELSTQEEKGLKILKKYGIEMADLDVKTRGFGAVLKTLTDAHVSAADAMELFGRRAGPGVLLFMQQGVREYDRMKERITGTNDAFRMQVLQNQTLQGAWRLLVSGIRDAKVEFGSGLNPVLSSVVGNLGKMVVRLRESDVFKRAGEALGTILKPVAEIGGGLGNKFIDWLMQSQDALAEKARELAQGIADWFTVPGEGGATGFQQFAADLNMIATAAWDLGKALAGASWEIIIAVMEKLWEKTPQIAAAMEGLIPRVDALVTRFETFLEGDGWEKLEGNIVKIANALDSLVQRPAWQQILMLVGLLMAPGFFGGLGGAAGKAVGGLLGRAGKGIGRLLGFGGKVAPVVGGKTLGPAAPIAKEVMGPALGGGRAPSLLGRALGGAGRLLGRVALPLGLAAHAYEGVQALRGGYQRGGWRGAASDYVNWIGPQAMPGGPLAWQVASRIGRWEYGLGRDLLGFGQPQAAMEAQAAGGYGTQTVIVIQTNDERRIGQIAQTEFDRLRGAQRRQLVRV